MVTEDYVSFETAKLLKEKGFDEFCRAFYVKSKEMGIEFFISTNNKNYNSPSVPATSAPTLQMAMKWLREEHNLYIDPYPEDNNTWCLIIWKLYPKRVIQCDGKYDDYSYSTYEKGCEAAIKYCLENLI